MIPEELAAEFLEWSWKFNRQPALLEDVVRWLNEHGYVPVPSASLACATPDIDPESWGGADLREMACGECWACAISEEELRV